MALLERAIRDTPLAVVDLETTERAATGDAIVEIAVVRVDPGEAPRLVLDTLINPQRRVTCSGVHGIYDEDVVGAPLITDVMGPLTEALDGAVIGAFNVYFDMRFLEQAFKQARVRVPLPHLCLMFLRPALDLGGRGTLGATCSALGITFEGDHQAARDAMATARLWEHYLRAADALGVRTFAELASRKRYKYVHSWSGDPLRGDERPPAAAAVALKPRAQRTEAEERVIRRSDEGEQGDERTDRHGKGSGVGRPSLIDAPPRQTLANVRAAASVARVLGSVKAVGYGTPAPAATTGGRPLAGVVAAVPSGTPGAIAVSWVSVPLRATPYPPT